MLICFDFEVFRYDWLVVFKDIDSGERTVFANDCDGLREFFNSHHRNTLFVGYNSRHYDNFILKTLLQGKNPYPVSKAIVTGESPWSLDRNFSRISFMSFDCMPNPPVGLKTLEAFLGLSIEESEVDFDIDRKLTAAEIESTLRYCEHDVDATIAVFKKRYADFESMRDTVKTFGLPWERIGETEPRIAATVLACERREWRDEYAYTPLPCIRVERHNAALDFFRTAYDDAVGECLARGIDPRDADAFRKVYYSRSLTIDVCGVPHRFGFGGLHGAPVEPVDLTGSLYHCDVASYYPSMLIAHDLVTRSAKHREKYREIYDTRIELKRKQNAATDPAERARFKAAQLPYKKILNSLSGAMKDQFNAAYDPRNNNVMCVSGQLMLLDLLERIEENVLGAQIVQSNTDGIIVRLRSDDDLPALQAVCAEWENRCSTERCRIALETDKIDRIVQRDVNNYITIADGRITERKGAHCKALSPLDYDLPIVNRALVAYLVDGTPIADTINACNNLIEFQRVVKLSRLYDHVLHEHGTPTITTTGVRVKKTTYNYPTVRYDQKCYRVFASRDVRDGRLLKVNARGSARFASLPDHCRLVNGDITDATVPAWLDREWYIDLAQARVACFKENIKGKRQLAQACERLFCKKYDGDMPTEGD